MNDYVLEGEADPPLHRPDPAGRASASASGLERTRAARDEAAATTTLEELKAAAGGDENLMPTLIACARARVSEGEMVAAMQEVFGTYTEHPQF